MEEQLRLEIEQRAILDNLVVETRKQLVDGMVPVPIKKFMDQAQYLQKHMLPQALAKFGPDNENYRFYKDLVDSLVWCIVVTERADFFRKELGYQRSSTEFFRAEAIRYRQELEKYHLVEDGLMNMPGFQKSFEEARQRIKQVLDV